MISEINGEKWECLHGKLGKLLNPMMCEIEFERQLNETMKIDQRGDCTLSDWLGNEFPPPCPFRSRWLKPRNSIKLLPINKIEAIKW